MPLFQRILLVAVVSLISGTAYAQSSSSSSTTSIKMLPPSDFSGNPCDGTKVGVLQWDGRNPIRCIPGFVGDSNGNVGIGTTPYNKLQIGSVGTSGYGGNSLAIGNGTSVFAITPFAGVTALYTNTNFAFVPSGSGATGNVGIGTTSPQVKLDVAGEARIGSSGDRCTSANEGAIRYDSSTKSFVGCNGADWTSLKGTLKTRQVSCVGVYEGMFNDYGCKATCPAGTQVTGGGFQWGAVISEWGRNMWQDGNGYHCLVNIDKCSSGAPSCGVGCYATCASIE